jgi:hypothetical protein
MARGREIRARLAENNCCAPASGYKGQMRLYSGNGEEVTHWLCLEYCMWS